MLYTASSHHTHVNQSARARQRGLTLAEVLIAVVCTVVLAALGWLFLSANRHGHGNGKLTKEATQARGIHQSWLVYAREFEGLMPTPGMINRLPFNGIEEPGRGEGM